MKKIWLVFATVGLLAASCNGNTPTAMEKDSSSQTEAMVEVKVNSVDDAVNLIEQNSVSEQSQVSAGDDSDLTASDSTEFNSLTEVQNAY